MFFSIANYPVIVVFFFIIAYHILLVTNKVNQLVFLYQRVCQLKEHFSCLANKRQNQTRRSYYGCNDSGDYNEVREPLLEQTLIN